MTDRGDETLLRRIQHELEHSVQSLDDATRSRLAAARHRALDAVPAPGRSPWLPAGGLALASLLAIAVIVGRLQPAGPDAELLAELLEDGPDLELVGAIEDLELLEDLDFYYWLEETQRDAG